MTPLSHLRALLAAATPGPWTLDEDVIRDADRKAVGQGNHGLQHVFSTVPIATKSPDQPALDADLIVAAVNNIEPLLAIAEAAVAWRDAEELSDATECTCGTVNGEDCTATPVIERAVRSRTALLNALARLAVEETP